MKRTFRHRTLSVVAWAASLFSAALLHAQDKPPVIQTNAPWESSAALGFTLTRGNSENLLLTATILTQRKSPMDEIALGANGAYGETTDTTTDKTTRNAALLHGFAQYNRFFTTNWYGYARLDGLHDDVADIHYRVSFSPGVGYYFIKNDKTRLSAEVGPGVVNERVGDKSDTYATLRLAEKFERKFNASVKVWESFEFLPQVDLWKNYIINAEVGVESALNKQLSLRTSVLDTYDNVPAPGRKNNDIKLVTAIAYKF